MKIKTFAQIDHKKAVKGALGHAVVLFGTFIFLRLSMTLLRIWEQRGAASELVFILFLHTFVFLISWWGMWTLGSFFGVKQHVLKKSVIVTALSFASWELTGLIALRLIGPQLLQNGYGSILLFLIGIGLSTVFTKHFYETSVIKSLCIVIMSLLFCLPLYRLFSFFIQFTL